MIAATEPRLARRPRRAAAVLPWRIVFAVLLTERLRERRWTPLVWGGGLGAMGALMVLVWPSIQATVGKLMASYPQELIKAFGITGFDTIERYVDGELFGLMVPFAAAFLAVRCVTGPVAGAEDAGQLDTWLAMPVPRRALAWSSFASAGVMVAATLLVMWSVTMAVSVVSGAGLSGHALGRGVLNVWPLAMVFAGIAVVTSGAVRGSTRANGAAMAALIAMYLADLVSRLASDLSWLRYLSAFRFYGSAIEHGLDVVHIGVLSGVAFALAAIGAEFLERRDV